MLLCAGLVSTASCKLGAQLSSETAARTIVTSFEIASSGLEC